MDKNAFTLGVVRKWRNGLKGSGGGIKEFFWQQYSMAIGGRGVKNYPKLCYVIYGWPFDSFPRVNKITLSTTVYFKMR